MKKNTTKLLTLALAVTGLVACTEQFQDIAPAGKTRTVRFSASGAVSKTALSVDGTTVTPDWRQTDIKDIHLFEVSATDETVYGETIDINVSSDNVTAQFLADFPQEAIIIVDPSGAKKDSGKGSTRVGPFTYTAVIAQKPDKDLNFVIPAEQHPDTETLKDPAADFLIGYSRKAYDEGHDWEENMVDLYFDRAAALGRLALTNFQGTGEKVRSVTIHTREGLTGAASYADIDFEKASVSFVRDEGPGALTLVYDVPADLPAEGPFHAYFVAIPGEVSITGVEVVTDQYRYTKTIDGGKDYTFSEKSFKNIGLDLATATAEEVGADLTHWYIASVMEDGSDYLIVSQGHALKNDGGEVGSVSVMDEEGMIILEEEDPTLVWTATAHTEMTGDNGEGGVVAGHFTLTNGAWYLRRESNTDILLGTTIPSDKPKYVVWDYDGSYLKHLSSESTTFYCFYDGGWTTAYTSNNDAPGSDIKTVQIYTNRAPQSISFSAASVDYDMDEGGEFVEPVLSDAIGEVTYSSSNPSVATVDASTGEVTVLKVGSTVITAVAAGNDEYQAASASYTIFVTSSQVDTFYLASEIIAGESYMVVSGGYAMTTDGSTLGAVPVTVNNGIIQISASEVSLFEAAAHIEYYENTSPAGHFTLSYGGKYLQRHSSQSTQTGDIGAENGKYYVWDYDGEHLYQVSRTGGSGTYYIYYNSGWTFENTSTPSHNTYLYTTTRQLLPRNLSFSKENVSVVLGQTPEKPALSGVTEGVIYSSSNTDVATVDENGNVTPVSVGTTTITASAEATDSYAAGSASYVLHVTDGSVPTWYKADAIEAGETYLIYSNGYLLQNDGGSIAALAVDENDGVIELDAPGTVLWTTTASSGKFTFKNDGQYLYRNSTNLSLGSNSVTWSYDSANSTITTSGSSSTYYLYLSSNGNKWTVSNSSGTTHIASLYTMNPARQAQNLVFSETSVTYDVASGTAFSAPTLSGAMTDVTWSSSNPAVATVSPDGAVAVVGTGTTVITADAAESDVFRAGTASYTLHVIDGSVPAKTYKKVTSASQLTVDAQYLLVYESTPSVFRPILDGSTFKKTSDNVQRVTISNNSITSAELGDCELTLKEGYYLHVASANRYLYPQVESSTTSLQAESSPSHSLTITIQSDGIAKVTNSENTTANLCWSTNSSYFSTTYSSSAAINVCLYKVDDGSSPGGDDPVPTGTTWYPASGIVAGQQYLIVSNGKALQNGGGSAAALDVTVNSGTIQLDAPSSVLWTAAADGEGFNFINNDQYLRRPSSGSTVGVGSKSSTADNNQWYYDADNQRVTVKHTSSSSGTTTTYYLKYNTSWEISTSTGNAVLYTTNP